MEAFLIYIAKSSLIIGLFSCCYFLFLQKETFFRANRWFLLGGIATAFVFPFITIKKIIENAPISNSGLVDVTATAQISQEIATSFNWWKIAFIIYTLGCLFFVIRLTIQLLSLYGLIKKGKHQKEKGYVLVKTETETSPFSFFGYIVNNPKLQSDNELQTILAHEKVHLTQKHSLDTVLTHLLCILQWANPFAWWYKKQVAQNLEYLADNVVATKMDNSKEYQYLLLSQSNYGSETISFTNTFFNSLIKKRIVMLNKNRSQKQKLVKMGIVVPLLVIALFTVNTEAVAQETTTNNETKNQWRAGGFGVEITADLSDEDLENISKTVKQSKIDLKFKDIKRNSDGKITAISSSFKSHDGSSGTMNRANTKPIVPFSFFAEIDNSGNIGTIGYMTIPKKWETVAGYGYAVNDGKNSNNNVKGLIKVVKGFPEDILVIIDGKEMDKPFDKNSLSPNNIESITVYNAKSHIKKYGEKGKNGVVLIITKK